MNKINHYNLSMRLHLAKITDQYKSVKDVIEDRTNNQVKLSKTNKKQSTIIVDRAKKLFRYLTNENKITQKNEKI